MLSTTAGAMRKGRLCWRDPGALVPGCTRLQEPDTSQTRPVQSHPVPPRCADTDI